MTQPIENNKLEWLSDCHNAPVKVVGGEEGTNHWECTECGKSCDAYQSKHSKYSPELEEFFDDLIFAINNNEQTSNYIFHEDDAHIKRYKEKLALYINKEKAKAEKDKIKLLDALYWMYVQYCSDKNGHMFMGAGERASELLEDAGYIVVDNIGAIIKDNGDSEEQRLAQSNNGSKGGGK